ncbi:MAG: 30S ribosomal protein S2, partial [Planctomycetota bacterium]
VVDVNAESNAVKEARKLGIPVVALLDTDSDPDDADIAIPGNDDAMRAIEIVIDQLARAVNEGKTARAQQAEAKDAQVAGEGEQPRKRSRRAQFSADAPVPSAEDADTAGSIEPNGTPEPAATN